MLVSTRLCASVLFLVVTLAGPPASYVTQTKTADPGMASMTSTLSGVFSAEQATRGETTYMNICVSCHPAGTYTTPAFRATWNGRPLSELFDFVKEKMPKNDPGTLTPDEYIQVVVYLLKINGADAGKTDLPADSEALKKYRIDMSSTNNGRGQ